MECRAQTSAYLRHAFRGREWLLPNRTTTTGLRTTMATATPSAQASVLPTLSSYSLCLVVGGSGSNGTTIIRGGVSSPAEVVALHTLLPPPSMTLPCVARLAVAPAARGHVVKRQVVRSSGVRHASPGIRRPPAVLLDPSVAISRFSAG